MTENKVCRYFLGANTKDGFRSLYEDFIRYHDDCFLWCIKGGPGNGKSSFMRRIGRAAEELGLAVEYILCSGDPDSLDGIYIPALSVIYADATSPHVLEPPLPGVNGRYLDLSAAYKREAALTGQKERIASLFFSYRAAYERAYSLLRGISHFPENASVGLLREKAEELFASVPISTAPYREERRFLSVLTSRGFLRMEDCISSAHQIIRLENTDGLAPLLLEELRSLAETRCARALLFSDPVAPEFLEGLYLPDAGVAFLAGERRFDPARDSLLRKAAAELARAKTLHDELESVYRPFLDTVFLDRLAEEHISALFPNGAEQGGII